ncbi:MAG: hypothetical protein KDH84_01180 [Calditrichaeota bacterium]|nr:hypothetical protein [Calditrichota bacterium]
MVLIIFHQIDIAAAAVGFCSSGLIGKSQEKIFLVGWIVAQDLKDLQPIGLPPVFEREIAILNRRAKIAFGADDGVRNQRIVAYDRPFETQIQIDRIVF